MLFMNYNNMNIRDTAFIGDVHGCHGLLVELLAKLEAKGTKNLVFLGDLVDRGPHPYEVVETVAKLVLEGKARALVGNHDWKFLRMFRGREVTLSDDQEETYRIVETRLDAFKDNMETIFRDTHMFFIDEENKFIASHAIAIRPHKVYTMKQDTQRTLAKWFWTGFLYGKTDGNTLDARGYPKRLPITHGPTDDLDGWKAIIGHYHANNLFLENGNKNVMCVDFCAGEGGKLAALTFNEGLEPELTFSDSSL